MLPFALLPARDKIVLGGCLHDGNCAIMPVLSLSLSFAGEVRSDLARMADISDSGHFLSGK